MLKGSPAGRGQNVEVIDHLWQAGEGRQLGARHLEVRSYSIRRDLSIRVPVDLLVIERKTPSVFWLQPRRGFAFSTRGLGVVASILRDVYLTDELGGAGLEILDVSAPHRGQRVHAEYRLSDLPIISDDEVAAVLQHLADAFDIVCRMGRDWDAEARTRSERRGPPPPPPPPGLFG
jgi:hypothetical protein